MDIIAKVKSMCAMLISKIKSMNRNSILICVAVIAIIITGILIFTDTSKEFSLKGILGVSKDEIAKNAVDYINTNQLSATPASLVSVSEESGLVKIKIKIGANEFDSYVTKDGRFLIPQVIDMKPAKADNKANQNTNSNQTPAAVTKADVPALDAYVVARCPFGIQMQRAMADAVKNIPSLAQYIKVRYIGAVSGNTITAMHGEAEAAENLRQICIREEQPTKYWAYVGCQMKASGTEKACEKSTGVDSAKLSACVSNPAKGVAYAKVDFDLNTKYNIQGSPTLVLNGAQVSESSYGGRSSDGVKSVLCAGFNNQPSFCSTKLNTAEAAASFSATYSSGSASASTGSAGCEAAQ